MDLASGAAEDYDPPPGDGKESDDATQNAIDNNPSTQWDTERYTDGLEGVNKSGVGLYVDAGSPIAARGMSLTTSTPGFKAAVYAANGVPEQISGWTQGERRLHGRRGGDRPVEHPRPDYRRYLLWITELPEGNKAAISRAGTAALIRPGSGARAGGARPASASRRSSSSVAARPWPPRAWRRRSSR